MLCAIGGTSSFLWVLSYLKNKIYQYTANNLYDNGVKYNLREAAELGYRIRMNNPDLDNYPSVRLYGDDSNKYGYQSGQESRSEEQEYANY